MKRFTYFLIIVLAVAIVIFIGYLLRSHLNTQTTAPSPTAPLLPLSSSGAAPNTALAQNASGTSSGIATGTPQFGVLSTDPAADFFVDASNTLYIVQPDGEIVEVQNGQSETLSSITVDGLINASFSSDGKEVMVAFGDRTNPQVSVFNLTTNVWHPLNITMRDPLWIPNTHKLLFLANDPTTGAGLLQMLNVDAAAPVATTVAPLNVGDVNLSWMSSTKLLIQDPASALVNGSAWVFDLQAKTLFPVVQDQPGLEVGWNPAVPGQGVSFTAGAGNVGGTLTLIDPAGVTDQTFSFLTLPSKCTLALLPPAPSDVAAASSSAALAASASTGSSTSTVAATGSAKTPAPVALPNVSALICAIPRDQDTLTTTQLPDAYNKKELLTSDDIALFDLTTGETFDIFTDTTYTLDATDVKVFNGVVFFINRYDNLLYGAVLPQEY